MEELQSEYQHDANRVEYVRNLVENAGPLNAVEAEAVSSTLEGIASKHQITGMSFAVENYCGGTKYALETCDQMLSYFLKHGKRY